jgi:hypothetical protein
VCTRNSWLHCIEVASAQASSLGTILTCQMPCCKITTWSLLCSSKQVCTSHEAMVQTWKRPWCKITTLTKINMFMYAYFHTSDKWSIYKFFKFYSHMPALLVRRVPSLRMFVSIFMYQQSLPRSSHRSNLLQVRCAMSGAAILWIKLLFFN